MYAIAPESAVGETAKGKNAPLVTQVQLQYYALLIYQLQQQGFEGDNLREAVSKELVRRNGPLSRREKSLLARFQWEYIATGFYPFKLHGKQLVLYIYEKEKPDADLSIFLDQGSFDEDTHFMIVQPFDKDTFMKKLIDPSVNASGLTREFRWLLKDVTEKKANIVRDAFDLIQSVSYMRTADIYNKLKDDARAVLLRVLGPQTIGRMIFGMSILNRDETFEKVRQQKKAEADRLKSMGKDLESRAKEIRDYITNEAQALAGLKKDYERTEKSVRREVKKIEGYLAQSQEKLIRTTHSFQADEMQKEGEILLAETQDPSALGKLIMEVIEEVRSGLSEGGSVQVNQGELQQRAKQKLQEKREKGLGLIQQAQALREQELPEDKDALESLVKPILQFWQERLAELRTSLEVILSQLGDLKTPAGKARIVAEFRSTEERRAKAMEKRSQELFSQAKEVEMRPINQEDLAGINKAKLTGIMDYVEAVLTQEPDFSADGVKQLAIRGQTAYEKFNTIVEVVGNTQGLYQLEQMKNIQDVTLRAMRREVGELIGVGDAVQFGVQKLLERGRPRFLFLNTNDYQRMDAVSGLALRLFQDEDLPIALRSKRIYRMDFSAENFPGDPESFLGMIKGIFSAAEKTGNIILAIDFNQIPKLFHQDSDILNAVLEHLLVIMQDHNVPVIGWIHPDNRRIFEGKKKFAEFFRKSAILVQLKMTEYERVLQIELSDIEKHNHVKFPSGTVHKALVALVGDASELPQFSDLEDLIRIFKSIAAQAELNHMQAISSEKVDKELEPYVASRKKPKQLTTGKSSAKGGVVDYDKAIRDRQLPEDVVEVIQTQAARLKQLSAESAEAGVIRTYLDTILSLPWDKSSEDVKDIKAVRKALDEGHYGLDKAKQKIIDNVGVFIRTGKAEGETLLLYGPPGVGKTSIAKSVAKALGRKFVRISLGGVRDEAEIRGHRRTYVGAMAGRIIKGLRDAGVKNPVILLDEIDKMGHDQRGDPASALLEVLDPEQNREFVDHYLELGFDLSQVFWMVSANDVSQIPPPLLDRTDDVELEGYSPEEKIQIAKQHLIPKMLSRHQMTSDEFAIASDDVILKIIQDYTREAGVRQLEKRIKVLVRRANLDLLERKTKKVTVDKAKVVEYLGEAMVNEKGKLEENEIGVVAGLAWSPGGGSVLFCESEIYDLEGGGKGPVSLKTTGSLQDVMRESVSVAFTVVRKWYKELGIDPVSLGGKEIHIHFPAGATPKDGPSAGVTISTALVSLLTGLPVNRNVAMTGEVSLRSRGVHAIGGLKQKIRAAYEAGMDTIIIPKENEKDLKDIDPIILKALKIIPVSRVEEVWEAAIPGLKERMEKTAKGDETPKTTTKIRRGDPDLTLDEAEALNRRLDETSYFLLGDSNIPKVYRDTYDELLKNLGRLKGTPYESIAGHFKSSAVIRVVQGEFSESLDLKVPGKKVYAYPRDGVIYITEKLLNLLKNESKVLAALILHELVEIEGGIHLEAEAAEFLFGRIGNNFSSLDLTLAVLELISNGVVAEPEDILSFIEKPPGASIEKRETALDLIGRLVEGQLMEKQSAQIGESLYKQFAKKLFDRGSIVIRTDLDLVEQDGVPLAEGIPDGFHKHMRTLERSGIKYVVLEGILNIETVEALQAGFWTLRTEFHQGQEGNYMKVGLGTPDSGSVSKWNILSDTQSPEAALLKGQMPSGKKVIVLDLDLLADVRTTDAGSHLIRPHVLQLISLKLLRDIRDMKLPGSSVTAYDVVLFSRRPGVAETLTALGLSIYDFNKIYTLGDLQANQGGQYTKSEIAKNLAFAIEADYSSYSVKNDQNDIILIYPEKSWAAYSSEGAIPVMHVDVSAGDASRSVYLQQALLSAVGLLSHEGQIPPQLVKALEEAGRWSYLGPGFELTQRGPHSLSFNLARAKNLTAEAA